MSDIQKYTTLSPADSRLVTGRQAYFLDVLGAGNESPMSVISFEAVERIGEPYRITLTLTHPDQLARSDYLGKDAKFSIVPADAQPRRFSGWITRFSKLKTTRDFTSYEIVVEAHLSRLASVRASRIYQHQTTPEIIEAVLRKHGFQGHQFRFRLRRQYPQHAFRMQYQVSDLAYVQMLMQKEGIWCRIAEDEHGDVVHFSDDIDHYVYQPRLDVPYRETAGLEAGVEAVYGLSTHSYSVAQGYTVADYNPDKAWERFKANANVASEDATTYGKPYIYGTNHLDADGAQWEAQLRHEAAIAWQIIYEGESNVLALQPARILHVDAPLADAPDGQVIVEVRHRGARDTAYSNSYRAIPSGRRFRVRLDEDAWPRVIGSLSARVTSPGKYKYAYLTQQGYYVVRFDLDFDEWNPGGESVPLRLAKPFAGALQTGFHFPALDGTEAVVEFRDGDPDKPYIAAFHHHSQAVDHVTSDDRWLSRNVIRTQSNNKLRMEDWEGQEGIKLSTEHSGKSQLNLGYLVDAKKQKRGEGFELRTSGYGAIRAGKGLFISADDRPNASGQQLDMQQAQAMLASALTQMKALGEMVKTAQAVLADLEGQNTLNNAALKDLQSPSVLVSAPAAIALVTPETIQHSAGDNVTLMAGKNIDAGAMENFTVAAGQIVSVFANAGGMKLVAAQGKNEIQAQSGSIEMTASQNIKMLASEGSVEISAKGSLSLKCGGAEIKLANGNIELNCPGDVKLNCITLQKGGPVNANAETKSFDILSCLSALQRVTSAGGAFV
ncbi:type VI secretion system Vgr family protein [Paraburkholderia caribensis]|uniref:type VI secretion system Vgr family protein n=1 Tax=Paraburkholderia caribensis TaxID=75105 RepID=UPI00078E1CE3|nr:type VI secretion system Vgr family protein [Paraburkholderia caribensis]AMV46770.1 type IV secretion protein Rhs [Paraburkholderia caribensis]